MWSYRDLPSSSSCETEPPPRTTPRRARQQTLAHLSDLHIGRGPANDAHAQHLCRALLQAEVDHVVVTGDLTHRGRVSEWSRFREIFAPLLEGGRMTLIPGNHDRLGDDLGDRIMAGARVQTQSLPGLFLLRLNSTGPHNRSWLTGHGMVTDDDIAAVEQALGAAPDGALVVLLLHHHPTPLPDDHVMERLSSLMGWKFTLELDAGAALLARLRQRCDLVLHGHRHKPAARTDHDGARPLRVFNAGSSTELRRACVFTHCSGRLSAPLRWVDAHPAPSPETVGLWNRVAHDLSGLAGHHLAF
jgi:3',5'-cyclic-AMP phosphodiesterase